MAWHFWYLFLEESKASSAFTSTTAAASTTTNPKIEDSGFAKRLAPEIPLDLSHTLPSQKVINSSNPEELHNTQHSSSSVVEEPLSGTDSDPGDDLMSPNRARNSSGQSNGKSQKRYRTNLTNMQIHVMKNMFKEYKTPTMAECEVLGSFIGLQKRVVQVWFQNARAKEKKNKLSYASSQATENDPISTQCSICDVKYTHQNTLQDHIFSAKHINNIRHMFSGKLSEVDKLAIRKQDEVRGRGFAAFPPLSRSGWVRSRSTENPLLLVQFTPLTLITASITPIVGRPPCNWW